MRRVCFRSSRDDLAGLPPARLRVVRRSFRPRDHEFCTRVQIDVMNGGALERESSCLPMCFASSRDPFSRRRSWGRFTKKVLSNTGGAANISRPSLDSLGAADHTSDERCIRAPVRGAARRVYEGHEKIYRAIESRDVEAADRMMAEHLNTLRSIYSKPRLRRLNSQPVRRSAGLLEPLDKRI
jgi:hypothetical protein